MNESKRLLSLDACRGFDMLFIAGLGGLISAVCALFPGGADSIIAQNMHHAEWNGLFHHDTIFPLFLFLAGVSFPFSYAKQQASGRTRCQIYRKIFFRALALFLLGLVYNGALSGPGAIRFCSVLARIGFAWMFAAILFMNFKTCTRGIISVVILVGYWAALRFIPVPGAPIGADPFSEQWSLATYIDTCILGGFDPEGIISTLPAIVTAMLGMFTGELVKKDSLSGGRKTLLLFVAAAVMLVVGLLWSNAFPINKKLWSSTFVLVVGAYSVALFALFYWIIDVKGWRRWAFFFQVVGLNSITIYMINRIIDIGRIDNFFFGRIVSLFPESIGPVVWHIFFIGIVWLILYFLYRKQVFLKV